MIKNHVVKLCILFFVLFVFWGCVSLLPPEEMKSQVANYRLPKLPDEGKAIVYVVNPSSFAKKASKHGAMFKVFLDNNDPQSEVGSTMGQQYTYFNITPGDHKILSQAGNWAEINVSAKAGDIIFIQQEPYMGWTTLNNKLFILKDYEGKYYVKTLARGTIINQQQTNVPAVPTQAGQEQIANADTFIGTIERFKNVVRRSEASPYSKIEVVADNGERSTFFVFGATLMKDDTGTQSIKDRMYKTCLNEGQRVEVTYSVITNGSSITTGQNGADLIHCLN